MFTKKSQGFTLIELLIVIAVIGILAGVVLAVINPLQQRNRASEAAARAYVGKACTAILGCINASSTGTCATPANEISAGVPQPSGVSALTFNPATNMTTAGSVSATVTNNSCLVSCSLNTGAITLTGAGCVTN